MTTLIELAKQVQEVRALQNRYFVTRNKTVLENSKQKEKLLDKTVGDIIEQDVQGKTMHLLFTDCPPLRRLTDMTYDEFQEYIAGKTRFAPSYMDQKIKSDFVSMAGFFRALGNVGEFDSYRRLKEAGFDVEFTLGWEGATIS